MKNLSQSWVVLVVLLLSSSTVFAEARIAVLNMERALLATKLSLQKQKALTESTDYKTLLEKFQLLQGDLKALGEEEVAKGMTWSNAQRAEYANTLKYKSDDYNLISKKLLSRRNNVIKVIKQALATHIEDVVTKVIEDEEISLLLNAKAAHFAAPGFDITEKVTAALDAIELHDDAISGRQPSASQNEIRALIARRQEEAQNAEETVAEKNKQVGQKFLAANRKKPGVVTTNSGLQYKIIEAGAGRTPARTDKVQVQYLGRLIDGTVFESSYDRGVPVTFPANGVISGWTEALTMMKEGAKWELYIPPELAYGTRGTGRDIGPNATLIFEVELLKILK